MIEILPLFFCRVCDSFWRPSSCIEWEFDRSGAGGEEGNLSPSLARGARILV